MKVTSEPWKPAVNLAFGQPVSVADRLTVTVRGVVSFEAKVAVPSRFRRPLEAGRWCGLAGVRMAERTVRGQLVATTSCDFFHPAEAPR